MLLVGCGSATIPSSPPDLSGNWQIQSGAAPSAGGNAPTGVLLLGALQSTGSKVTGTLRFTNISQPACDLNDVITVTGTVDAGNMLTLTSSKLHTGDIVSIHLLTAPTLGSSATGTVQVSGGACPYASAAAIGVKVASVTGTYAGPLLPGTLGKAGISGGGPAVLQVTQSQTPNPDGQFAVTSSLAFTVGTCMIARQFTGTVSGVGLILANNASSQVPPPTSSIFAFADPAGASLKIAELLILPVPCGSATSKPQPFTGTLTKQ